MAEPTRSTCTVRFGTWASLTGTSSVVVALFISNERVSTMPERRMLSSPCAGKNGLCTSRRAFWPGRYSLASGTSITSSCATLRTGGVSPPDTQTRIWLWLGRPALSLTVASTR